ncbi:methyltransferase family protein [Rhodopila sp.]|uniref:methyltransferase family protein n=1 Tax=Rhodopila sp. TaxID=2480087 RepID=UPI003D13EC50
MQPLIQAAGRLAMMGVILFLAAGDWRWPQGWMFLGEFATCSTAMTVWLARHDPALLRLRLSLPVQRDQKPWDRIFMSLAVVAVISWAVVIAFDARRFRWSHVPLWAQMAGGLLIGLSMVAVWQTFRFNSFAVPQVRVQAERGQRVVSEGPYRIVRHPMYAATIPYFAGMPLLLGSWWGLIAVPLFTVGLGVRAVGEERMLRDALAGYDDYTKRVRFRLIPGLW